MGKTGGFEGGDYRNRIKDLSMLRMPASQAKDGLYERFLCWFYDVRELFDEQERTMYASSSTNSFRLQPSPATARRVILIYY
jgi:hypothetical protein